MLGKLLPRIFHFKRTVMLTALLVCLSLARNLVGNVRLGRLRTKCSSQRKLGEASFGIMRRYGYELILGWRWKARYTWISIPGSMGRYRDVYIMWQLFDEAALTSRRR